MSVLLVGAKSAQSDIQLAFQTNVMILGLNLVGSPPGAWLYFVTAGQF